MDKFFEYLGQDENGNHRYSYEFSMGDIKIGEDDGRKYSGLSLYDEVVYLVMDQFKWNMIKEAYKLDTNTPEGMHEFMTRYDPNYKTTLEELKANWDNDISDLK